VSVLRSDDSTVVLDGDCPPEDAETLLRILQSIPAAEVDWRRCRFLHTAVLQIVMASGTSLIGPCGDAWVAQWVHPESPAKKD
jgi:hypothetical protein